MIQQEIAKSEQCHKKKLTQTKKVEDNLLFVKSQLEPIIKSIKLNQQAQSKKLPVSSNLLSRATSKIIDTYQEKLGDLILDDMLFEIVDILNEEEERKNKQQLKLQQQCVFNDFTEELQELYTNQEEIRRELLDQRENRQNKIRDIISEKQKKELYEKEILVVLNLEESIKNKIKGNKKTWNKYINTVDYYNKQTMQKYLVAGDKLFQELTDEAYKEINSIQDKFIQDLILQEFE